MAKVKLALWVVPLALAGCESTPQARYLTPGAIPICLAGCTVVVTNSEAAQFPELRQVGDVSNLTKSTSQSPTTTKTTP